MHFIEQLLGVSPDNGSGSLELMLFLLPLLVATIWTILRPRTVK